MKPAIVFIGPSIPAPEDRPTIPAVRYVPPVRRGDLVPDLWENAACIAIVDGEFDQSLAVTPREVMKCIRAHTTVFGSSSMGALRSAELHTVGMHGVGKIFEMYRDEVIAAEDEVALLFDPDSQRPVTEPLVNIRCSVERAVASRHIDASVADAIIQQAEALHYRDRRYGPILRLAGERLGRDLMDLKPILEGWDQKREDAFALLGAVQRYLEQGDAS